MKNDDIISYNWFYQVAHVSYICLFLHSFFILNCKKFTCNEFPVSLEIDADDRETLLDAAFCKNTNNCMVMVITAWENDK